MKPHCFLPRTVQRPFGAIRVVHICRDCGMSQPFANRYRRTLCDGVTGPPGWRLPVLCPHTGQACTSAHSSCAEGGCALQRKDTGT